MQNVVWREHTLGNIFVKKVFLSTDSTIISKLQFEVYIIVDIHTYTTTTRNPSSNGCNPLIIIITDVAVAILLYIPGYDGSDHLLLSCLLMTNPTWRKGGRLVCSNSHISGCFTFRKSVAKVQSEDHETSELKGGQSQREIDKLMGNSIQREGVNLRTNRHKHWKCVAEA